jgi:anti-sigma factor RsiW
MTTSACTSYRPQIGSREAELAPEARAALEAHLAGCQGCRGWAARLAATEGLVSEALLAAASRRDFAPFVDQVMARIEGERPAPFLERLLRAVRLHPRVVVGSALAPLVAALALVMYVELRPGGDLTAARSLEVSAVGRATTIIQSSDGPLVLLDDDDDEAI